MPRKMLKPVGYERPRNFATALLQLRQYVKGTLVRIQLSEDSRDYKAGHPVAKQLVSLFEHWQQLGLLLMGKFFPILLEHPN